MHLAGSFSRVCSRILTTDHPDARSRAATRRSRLTLPAILTSQYPLFDLDRRSQTGQPCQKHPSMKTTTRAFVKTRSGRPSRPLFRRHPVKRAARSKRINRSSVVALPVERIRDIVYDRCFTVMSSAILRTLARQAIWNTAELYITAAVSSDTFRSTRPWTSGSVRASMMVTPPT